MLSHLPMVILKKIIMQNQEIFDIWLMKPNLSLINVYYLSKKGEYWLILTYDLKKM